jgi:hypothetical protein
MKEETKLSGHKRFYELLDKIAETHSRKNSDYSKKSDPLSNLKSSETYFEVPAWIGTAIRMSDKWERFTNLVKKRQRGEGPAVKDESIKDTLEDLAVYCLLEVILIEESENNT